MAVDLIPNKMPVLLIVDDNATNLQVLGSILREYTVKIAVAQSGEAALNLVNKVNPDLVLLDIMMPEMDGYEVCSTLQSQPETSEIPVIFLSAKNETEDIVRGFQTGGVDYLTKPFQKEELVTRVKNHLNLKFARDDLKALNEFKDRMISVIGHDLRNPVGTIKMALNFLIHQAPDPDSEEYQQTLKILFNSVDESLILLENILCWSRSQSGVIEVNKEEVAVDAVLRETGKLLQSQADVKNVEFKVDTPENLTAQIDPNILATVLRNLTSNAIKFTKSGGHVTLSAALENGGIRIMVQDDGIGMSEEQVQKIYSNETFSTKGTGGEAGTGFGLALTMDFIQRCEGELHVESEKGKGSTFWFDIPAA